MMNGARKSQIPAMNMSTVVTRPIRAWGFIAAFSSPGQAADLERAPEGLHSPLAASADLACLRAWRSPGAAGSALRRQQNRPGFHLPPVCRLPGLAEPRAYGGAR